MDPASVPGHNDERKLFQQFLGQFGGPAFVRRGREVQAAYERLIAGLYLERESRLGFVRLHLGTLFALAGDVEVLQPLLANAAALDNAAALANLRELHEALQPRLRIPVEPTQSVRRLKAALAELSESIEGFNQRWRAHVKGIDLSKINKLRDDFNRYYLLEKECALGSIQVARQGFRKLEPLTHADLLDAVPTLPVV